MHIEIRNTILTQLVIVNIMNFQTIECTSKVALQSTLCMWIPFVHAQCHRNSHPSQFYDVWVVGTLCWEALVVRLDFRQYYYLIGNVLCVGRLDMIAATSSNLQIYRSITLASQTLHEGRKTNTGWLWEMSESDSGFGFSPENHPSALSLDECFWILCLSLLLFVLIDVTACQYIFPYTCPQNPPKVLWSQTFIKHKKELQLWVLWGQSLWTSSFYSAGVQKWTCKEKNDEFCFSDLLARSRARSGRGRAGEEPGEFCFPIYGRGTGRGRARNRARTGEEPGEDGRGTGWGAGENGRGRGRARTGEEAVEERKYRICEENRRCAGNAGRGSREAARGGQGGCQGGVEGVWARDFPTRFGGDSLSSMAYCVICYNTELKHLKCSKLLSNYDSPKCF